ncbi:MAG: winged helix-turn-helix domain-containing protein [Methanocellales archaeon]|nr:winged helix-turn-helix domain-containing protein [Methanocellales archaeon]MDD3292144.1 winged helix-turn-helix domain-containing protein [Methanocellales archaeon]MDD5235381.1 winged helix-turn-helix domain-containing protein [Methanocellales archaeon]MDD5485671.1 winged helix-turn-helix domain-containing protein [Methanocellales archaeon]
MSDKMACISPDGKPTALGEKILEAAKDPRTPEEIASTLKLPLFRVRSGLRDLVEAGYLKEEHGKYMITEKGLKALE